MSERSIYIIKRKEKKKPQQKTKTKINQLKKRLVNVKISLNRVTASLLPGCTI